jgi:hypothetical protein
MSRMPRWTDEQLDEAETLRASGEKWIVVEAMMGEGIKNACEYRRMRQAKPPVCTCNGGRVPCSCKPDAWKLSDGRLSLTEPAYEPGVMAYPLFMRGRP